MQAREQAASETSVREKTAPTVAVAIPAHNEGESLAEFLTEIDGALRPRTSALFLVVVDDCSTDNTQEVLAKLAPTLESEIVVARNATNLGHGPTLLEAYRRALDTGAELILQVDGDGQFLGSDLRRVAVLLEDGAAAVCGVRRFRYDPWFRMLMTRALRLYISSGFGVPTRDANCPLRGYHASLLDDLLQWIPDNGLVPNLYLTILAARRGATMVEVDVNHRVRRGGSAMGTMWSGRRRSAYVGRLLKFSWRAFRESTQFHSYINSGRRPPADARQRRA